MLVHRLRRRAWNLAPWRPQRGRLDFYHGLFDPYHAIMKLKNILFFGTPDFSVPTLKALCEDGRTPIKVITQPGRAAGRGRSVRQPPVHEWATEHGLAILQPEMVSAERFLDEIRDPAPSLAVVVAFGQIFRQPLLDLPVHGCINLHASLLPKHRGAAPIQAAIVAGEDQTGVTTMQMERGLDSGPILLQRTLGIGADEKAGSLSDRLAEAGAELVVETILQLEEGTLQPQIQVHEEATLAPRLTREMGRVDWTLTAGELYDRLRAYTPWPGFHAEYRERPIKIVWARPAEAGGMPSGEPGRVVGLIGDQLQVECGAGSILSIERLQRPGKGPVTARDFVNGEHLQPGDIFS